MKRNSTMSLFAAMLLLTGSGCILMTGCQKDYDGQIGIRLKMAMLTLTICWKKSN